MKSQINPPVEFKESAAKLANESSNVAEIARELVVKEDTLYNWLLGL